MKALFQYTQSHWFEQAQLPQWNGPTLLSVDGVVWRTPESAENNKAFSRAPGTQYPKVRMVYQMELSNLNSG